ncbi:MAG: hypothetical protein OJF51_002977 [Nitrospira sp.]|jgi:hypothetical protein|nr:MAG: hypothetical protein OJF51_002977 [Nitrospira sp.]
MKVRFRQTGGFGGLVLGCDLDTDVMPRDEAEQLLLLIRQANIQEAGERRHPHGRDLLVYEIVLEERGRRTRSSFDSMSASPQAESLVQFLAQRARAVPLE